jgi:hypothetical protein
MAIAGIAQASPIGVAITVDTTTLGASLALDFELTETTANQVRVYDFTSDGGLGAVSLRVNAVNDLPGTPATPLTLGGDPASFFQSSYVRAIAPGAGLSLITLQFTFDTDSLVADPIFGPDQLSLFFLDGGAPVATGGPGDAVLTFDIGDRSPTFYSSAIITAGPAGVPEPGALALVAVALAALAFMRRFLQVRLRN